MTARAQALLAWTAVCVAASLPYVPSLSFYFVQDDFGVVQLLAAKPWTTFPRWFTMPWMEDIWGYTPDEIRPFPAVSYQLTALWGASAPEGHHLANIVFHAANALLVMKLARTAAGLRLVPAAAGAVTFAVLPVGAESVAWITGRVDTMPTLFYLAAFLAYVRWRQGAGERLYAWALVWYFLALFSKQNTITLPAALIACDILLARTAPRAAWASIRLYVPFVLLTAGFLGLRYAVLGEVLRESRLGSLQFDESAGVVLRHVQRIVFGAPGAGGGAAAAGLAGLAVALAAVRLRHPEVSPWRALLFFGPIWMGLGLAPAVAAGYESPRHAYLAATGWGIVCAIGLDALWHAASAARRPNAARAAVLAVLLLVAGTYAWRLHGVVEDWGRRAAVSRTAALELERHAREAEPGTLILIGVPVESWEWAAPFVARPPYAGTDLTERAFIVTPRLLDCCRGRSWEERTRTALQEWAAQAARRIVALYVAPDGEVRRLTGEDDEFSAAATVLPTITSADSLDGALQDLLTILVAGRGEVVRPALTGGTRAQRRARALAARSTTS